MLSSRYSLENVFRGVDQYRGFVVDGPHCDARIASAIGYDLLNLSGTAHGAKTLRLTRVLVIRRRT